MGKYQPYPEYNLQNNEWLAETPAHWQLVPLKRLLAQKVSDGPHETPQFQAEGVPFLSVDGIQGNRLVFEGCRYVTEDDHQRYSLKCKPRFGDVLLGKAASVGKVAYVDTAREFNVWSPLAVIRPKRDTTAGRFIFFAIQSKFLQAQCVVRSNANTQNNLGMGDIENLKVPAPGTDEQHIIAAFLDHETAKIDRLIAKQERLIELLKEKRQAVIFHAVTKGLTNSPGANLNAEGGPKGEGRDSPSSPDASMKDSGVAWLGEVPAHWEVSTLKRFAERIVVGIAEAATHAYVDEGIPILRATNVRPGKLVGNLLYLDPVYAADRGSKRIKGGDLVTVRTGNAGITAIVPDELDGCQCFTMLITTLSKKQSNRFFEFLIGSPIAQSYFSVEGWGTAQVNISVPILQNLPVAVPPLEEQEAIVAELDKQIGVVDELIRKAGRAIELQREHRTALISAAVTGKIDVRGWQKPNNAPQEAATAASA